MVLFLDISVGLLLRPEALPPQSDPDGVQPGARHETALRTVVPENNFQMVQMVSNGSNDFNFQMIFRYLDAYMTRMLAHRAFTETKCPEETVVWGWEGARK